MSHYNLILVIPGVAILAVAWLPSLLLDGRGLPYGGGRGRWLAGRVLSFLIFDLPHRVRINPEAYGFVSLAVTLTAYGATELLHGYGFLAVFVAVVTLRRHERSPTSTTMKCTTSRIR